MSKVPPKSIKSYISQVQRAVNTIEGVLKWHAIIYSPTRQNTTILADWQNLTLRSWRLLRIGRIFCRNWEGRKILGMWKVRSCEFSNFRIFRILRARDSCFSSDPFAYFYYFTFDQLATVEIEGRIPRRTANNKISFFWHYLKHPFLIAMYIVLMCSSVWSTKHKTASSLDSHLTTLDGNWITALPPFSFSFLQRWATSIMQRTSASSWNATKYMVWL